MSKDERIKELQDQITQLELEKELAEKWSDDVRALSSFNVDDKVQIFDALYKQCANYLKTLAETGWPPKDGEHYLWEFAMEKCLGVGVWKIIRAIQR